MNSIFAIALIIGSILNPFDSYYQEYDAIGEMTIASYEKNVQAGEIGMMPLVEITAERALSISAKWDIPEIIITAQRYSNQDIKPYYGMMPEVVITADRYTRPNGLFILSQLSDNSNVSNISSGNSHARFDMYPLILIIASFALWLAAYMINRFRSSAIPMTMKRSK